MQEAMGEEVMEVAVFPFWPPHWGHSPGTSQVIGSPQESNSFPSSKEHYEAFLLTAKQKIVYVKEINSSAGNWKNNLTG